MTEQQVAKVPNTFQEMLNQEVTLNEIRKALPKDKKSGVDRIARIALTEFRKSDALRKCDPISIVSSIVQSAQLGLEVGGVAGQVYFIPYGSQCTIQIGYRGMIELAYRSGYVSSIQPNAVYENDIFSLIEGTSPEIIHRRALSNRGEAIGYYIIARLKSGDNISKFMAIEEINTHRDKFSKAFTSGREQAMKFWKESYEAMALKTVMRQLFKWLPQSSEMIQALEVEVENDNIRKPKIINMDENGQIYDTTADKAASMIDINVEDNHVNV